LQEVVGVFVRFHCRLQRWFVQSRTSDSTVSAMLEYRVMRMWHLLPLFARFQVIIDHGPRNFQLVFQH
jgi:hypothetical protein